jgi:Flp pilus assembly pilin Flp
VAAHEPGEKHVSAEVFYAMGIITFVRARADRARRAGFNERGASAIEWAIISAVVVILALVVARVIQNVVTENSNKIEQGTNTP